MMIRYVCICLQLASIIWGQVIGPGPVGPSQDAGAGIRIGLEDRTGSAVINQRTVAAFDPGTPIITLTGICDDNADEATTVNCKTVITLAEFTKIIDAVQPNMSIRIRKEFAQRYARLLMLADKAQNLGLDSGEKYEEQMRLARLEILAKEMSRQIERRAEQISDRDIEEYYEANAAQFEEAELSRIYLSKVQETPKRRVQVSGGQESENDLNALVERQMENLRVRAVAGENFRELQEEVSLNPDSKSGALPNLRRVRRASLPHDQQSVMDLSAGQISPVFADANGYVIYRLEIKNLIPLDGVRAEIRAALRSQRIENQTEEIEKASNPVVNDDYFYHLRMSR